MRAFALAAVAGLVAVGCTPDYVKDNNSPVHFFVNVINSGNVLRSDVSTPDTDTVTVSMSVRSKNPNFTTFPQVAMAVDLTQYSVRFFRTDGHNVEGVDVPYHFSGALQSVIEVGGSGTVEIPLVRASAKQEPPLRNLRAIFPSTNTNPVTGRPVIQMIAEITVYGETTALEQVSDSGRVTVEFSDLP